MNYGRYNRSVTVLSEQGRDFAAGDGKVAGYLKIETGNNKGAMRCSVENLRPFPKGDYLYKLILFGSRGERTIHAVIGTVPVGRSGNGEAYFRFNPVDVDGRGNSYEYFSTAIVASVSMRDDQEPLHPILKGNTGNEPEELRPWAASENNEYRSENNVRAARAGSESGELFYENGAEQDGHYPDFAGPEGRAESDPNDADRMAADPNLVKPGANLTERQVDFSVPGQSSGADMKRNANGPNGTNPVPAQNKTQDEPGRGGTATRSQDSANTAAGNRQSTASPGPGGTASRGQQESSAAAAGSGRESASQTRGNADRPNQVNAADRDQRNTTGANQTNAAGRDQANAAPQNSQRNTASQNRASAAGQNAQSPGNKSRERRTFNRFYNEHVLHACVHTCQVAEYYEEVKPFSADKTGARWKKIMNITNLPLVSPGAHYFASLYHHFLFGARPDDRGYASCYFFAIPGRRLEAEQPDGGRSGFVYWQPMKGMEGQKNPYGYWIVEIDGQTGDIREVSIEKAVEM